MSFLSKLFPCLNNDDDPPPRTTPPQTTPDNPWTIGPIVNGVNYSAGMPLQPTATGDGSFFFDFPTAAPGVHGVTRPWVSVAGGTLTLQFKIDGNATFLEVASFDDVQSPGLVRLFLQRSGDNWSGTGGYASYRFYSQPLALAIGESSLSVQLSPEVWTNVNGQQDPAGFAAVLADLATIGFGLGGDAAMHGAIAVGQARFTIIALS